jgi:cation diffusion facilitator family transporter
MPTPDSSSELAVHPAARGVRSTLVGIALNLILALVKGAAGYLGNSYALIADAIESLSDVFSSMVVYVGLRIAMKPPDENHPYGHGKAEPMAAMAVSIALFAAALLITVESIREIITPHHAPAPFTLWVLAGVVAAKEILFRYVFKVGEEVESMAVKTDAWHHRSDAITSALAFVGISIALIGGRGFEPADDWAALGAAGIIIFNAYRLLRPAIYELSDAAPAAEIEAQVRRVAATVPGVTSLDRCYVRKMGFDYYVDLHVKVDGDLSVREGHRIAHEVQDAVRHAYPRIAKVLVHIEPEGGFGR